MRVYSFSGIQSAFLLNPACGEAGREPVIENKIMIFSSSSAGDTALPLALGTALSVLAGAPAFAQSTNEATLAPVVVTASRFASDPALRPIGATVITADKIREAGINNVNEAIRKLGGVYGRQGFSGTQDFSLDLSGFGAASDQNMVVLVDGIRLSENELSPALLSSVPIESVARIEIVRGGSSVLYGDGATGGTIQIITKRGAKNGTHGTVAAEVGSYGHRELRASASKGWDGFSLDANASTLHADNYRDNNASTQKNFNGGMQWASNEGRIGLRVEAARQDSGFPGSLSLAQFEQNPRQTTTPNDHGSFDTDRYTFFAERHLGSVDLAVDLSHRTKTANSVFSGSSSRYDSQMNQVSPRLRYLSGSANMKNELVAGLDFTNWSRSSVSAFSNGNASQKSRAVYVRDELKLGKTRLAAGIRHEVFDKDFIDPLGFATTAYDKTQSLNAWELQASHMLTSEVDVFAKGGQSYRVANVDENGFTPISNQPLEPQISHDIELGTTLGKGANKMTARLFRHRLTNEIFYDPTSSNPFTIFDPTSKGANVNLDPTQRQGVGLDGSIRLASAFVLSGNLQHLSAKFTDGPNTGKEIPLVPRNTASLRLNWLPENGQSAMVGVQWADVQRYGGDFSNSCSARIPSFTTMDARYAKQMGKWEFAIAGSNLTDRHYFTNAFGACQNGIYPDTGRLLKVSARLDF
jgi:iron complex outermembrane receptor protein